MKAYIAQEQIEYTSSTVVFAETPGKARAIAMRSDAMEWYDLSFTEIWVRRAPQMDKYYRGLPEMDWLDENDRIAMVKDAGFSCSYEFDIADLDCETCPAKEWCDRYESINA